MIWRFVFDEYIWEGGVKVDTYKLSTELDMINHANTTLLDQLEQHISFIMSNYV